MAKALMMSFSEGYIRIWTLQSYHGCLDSCLLIEVVNLYAHIRRYRFEYRMRGGCRSEGWRIGEEGQSRRLIAMKVIGSRERMFSRRICRRSMRGTRWL